jgi:hypothetical protein
METAASAARASVARWHLGRGRRALTIPAMWAKMIRVLPSIPIYRGFGFLLQSWACGAAGSALPWHGRGRRFDPDQVHQISQPFSNEPVVSCAPVPFDSYRGRTALIRLHRLAGGQHVRR